MSRIRHGCVWFVFLSFSVKLLTDMCRPLLQWLVEVLCEFDKTKVGAGTVWLGLGISVKRREISMPVLRVHMR